MSPLELRIEPEKTSLPLSEPVKMALVLTNRSDREIRLDFSSAQRFDISARDRSRSEVWRWSRGRMFAMVLGWLVVPPSGEHRFEATWTPSGIPPGPYTLTARITCRAPECPESPPVTINLTQATPTDPE